MGFRAGIRGAVLLGAATLAPWSCAPPDPLPSKQPGRLVIIGGALQADNDAVYDAVLEGLGGPGPLCVIPTASASPRSSMESAMDRFRERVPEREVRGILLTVDNAGDARSTAMADALAACAGFFFTGGSQSRILDVFRPGNRNTPAWNALRNRWQAGAVVAGTSAGAAMMSRRSINGGGSAGALRYGVSRDGEGEGVWVREGLGFTDRFVVDQHFLARGRWGRLAVAVLADSAVDAGAGIDENTALVVERGTARVVGASGVVWMRESGGQGRLTLDLLGRGDRIDLRTAVPTRRSGRRALGSGAGAPGEAADGGGGGPVEPDAGRTPFARWALLHLLEDFGRRPETRLELREGPSRIILEKAPGFSAAAGSGPGVQGAAPGLSVGPLRVRVEAPGIR